MSRTTHLEIHVPVFFGGIARRQNLGRREFPETGSKEWMDKITVRCRGLGDDVSELEKIEKGVIQSLSKRKRIPKRVERQEP